MANKNKKFLISVCDVYARDVVTKAGIFAGKSLLSSTFTVGMTATDVRGGDGNILLMKYMHDRTVTAEITSATFMREFLEVNTGSTIGAVSNALVSTTECITFASGVGTMIGTAVGTVAVFFEDGSCETVTPTTKTLTLSDTTYNGIGTAFYNTNIATGVDQLSIGTTTPPKVVDLTLVAKVKDADGILISYMNINIPRFQVEGNYDLSFSADGVSQDKITGSALSVNGTNCTQGDTYAIVSYIPVTPVTPPSGD